MVKPRPQVCHYFVDEAGDTTVFGRRGRVLVGTGVVSGCFMVGVCELPDPAAAAAALTELRRDLLADPFYRGVPSMQPAARKTALAFHAKDDLAEVRREVFRVIPALNPKIVVAVRRKAALVELGKAGVKITPNRIYDDMIAQASNTLLHRADEHRIVIAKRGNTTRNAALLAALERGRESFNRRHNTSHRQTIHMSVGAPSDHAGLQVTDYLLWALGRLFERREDRFFAAMADHYSLIYDLDDKREKAYGQYYRRRNPPTLDTLLPLFPG